MIWKDVKGYENIYQVSELGEVKSFDKVIYQKDGRERFIKGRIMKQRKNNKDYHIICLSKDGKKKTFLVHRLVAIAFIENPDNLEQVNHKDGNKSNNSKDNLEWMTQPDNMKHAYDNNLRDRGIGRKLSQETKDKMSKSRKNHKAYYHKPVAQIDPETDEIIKVFNSTHDASKEFNCSHTSISEVARGKKGRKTTKGFKWKYVS